MPVEADTTFLGTATITEVTRFYDWGRLDPLSPPADVVVDAS